MPTSLPALAVYIAQPELSWPCTGSTQTLRHEPFVPAYRVPASGNTSDRVQRLADAVSLMAERLDRLPQAFAHWRQFDTGAYFDLRPKQTRALVRFEQLGAIIDVTIHADALSPAFRAAERFWAQEFCPGYHAADHKVHDAFTTKFLQRTLPAMQRRMQRAREEISAAGELLFQRGDTTFLSAAAAPDERERQMQSLSSGDVDLFMVFLQIPTLTLSRSFDIMEFGRFP